MSHRSLQRRTPSELFYLFHLYLENICWPYIVVIKYYVNELPLFPRGVPSGPKKHVESGDRSVEGRSIQTETFFFPGLNERLS